MKFSIKAALVAMLAFGTLPSAAQAAVINPVVVSASSEFPTYGASFAADGNALTDWASLSQGAGSFLNLDLGGIFSLASAYVTDRVTSGGGNGAFVGGVSDFTTQFGFQFYTDSTFLTTVGSLLTFNAVVPNSPTTPADFQTVASLNGATGQFLQYRVLATNGAADNNPGLSEIFFTTAVPEPSTWALMIIGFAGLGFAAVRRSRRDAGQPIAVS